MKLIFLSSCKADIEWFRRYYRNVFPAGQSNGWHNFDRAKMFLKNNPQIGRPLDDGGLRKFSIPRTPFSFVYKIGDGVIQVVRVWDQRAKRPDTWT